MNVETIFEDMSPQLLRFIRQRVGDPQTAEDILQEVFVRIHTRLDSLRDESRLRSWVYRITRNAIADHYRMKRETLELSDTLALPEEADAGEITGALLASVKSTLACLPDKYRQALLLTEYRGLTQLELADRLGLSLSGAKSRVQRARQQLKEMLLDCCDFELDRFGKVLDFQPKVNCCAHNGCQATGQ